MKIADAIRDRRLTPGERRALAWLVETGAAVLTPLAADRPYWARPYTHLLETKIGQVPLPRPGRAMIDLTPEEEARLRRWLALEADDIERAVWLAAEQVLAPEHIQRMADQIADSIIPDIEQLLVSLNERLTALERIVTRSMPVVRRQQ